MATRLRDMAFKRELQRMPIGAPVCMEGPYGKSLLHPDQIHPAVFLAGGIRITPVRSLVAHAAKERSRHRKVLFYFNRRPEDARIVSLNNAGPTSMWRWIWGRP